jgi:KipI family sensor histidine kinase inhibitor
MVRFDPVVLTRAALRDVIAPELDGQDWANVSPPAPTRRWHIPVCFGPDQAPQLDEIAALAGCSPDQAIEAITGTDLSVLAIGFAPGQPYLGMLPDNWGFARQSELTPMVPAGAVVVALRQVVLFANDSPTGWRQAGQSAFRPFLLTRPEPLVLRAGDGVRFHTVGVGEFEALVAANSDGLGGATCEVLS